VGWSLGFPALFQVSLARRPLEDEFPPPRLAHRNPTATRLHRLVEQRKIPSEFTGEGVLVCGPAPPEAFDYDFTSAAKRAGLERREGDDPIIITFRGGLCFCGFAIVRRCAFRRERLNALKIPSEFTGEGVLVCGPAPPEAFDYDFTSAGAYTALRTTK
jgi:tartrate dehydratase beta subunit/fumarate hydratase class I family protein